MGRKPWSMTTRMAGGILAAVVPTILAGAAHAAGGGEARILFYAAATAPLPELSTVPQCFQIHPSTALGTARRRTPPSTM